jgi:hypothetical protein
LAKFYQTIRCHTPRVPHDSECLVDYLSTETISAVINYAGLEARPPPFLDTWKNMKIEKEGNCLISMSKNWKYLKQLLFCLEYSMVMSKNGLKGR